MYYNFDRIPPNSIRYPKSKAILFQKSKSLKKLQKEVDELKNTINTLINELKNNRNEVKYK